MLLPINAALFRKLEEDTAEAGARVEFFEVDEREPSADGEDNSIYTLINVTFGIIDGKLVA